MKVEYKKANSQDADALINIYNESFMSDYLTYGECPAYGRTRGEMVVSISNFPKYIIMYEGEAVGAISYQNKGEGYYSIGCLCVIPSYQGRGIGRHAVEFLLSICADWEKITLVTPVDKEENIKFYTEKCGFSVGESVMDGKVKMVTLIANKNR